MGRWFTIDVATPAGYGYGATIMPLNYRYGPINTDVTLHLEADIEGRTVKEFAGAERVYWAQCPRCRQRFWFALRYDTGSTELQFFGKSFRDRFRAEDCPEHTLDPLVFPATATESA